MSEATKTNGSVAALLRDVPARVLVWVLLIGMSGLVLFITRDWTSRLSGMESKVGTTEHRVTLCEEAIKTFCRSQERIETKLDRLIERKNP